MIELKAPGVHFLKDEPMSRHTTLGIGGPADWYAEVQSVSQLSSVVQTAGAGDCPLFFLGSGSNLLVSDRGIPGLVVRLKGDFEKIEFQGAKVRAGAGVFLPTLVKECATNNLTGCEALVGVPGTVGGALVMNAGTRELEIGSLVLSVQILGPDGSLINLQAGEIEFRYRESSLSGKMICSALLQMNPGKKEDILRTVQGFLSHRLKTQPIGTMNVGSIFKNKPDVFAGKLIEESGLKGFKKGGAQVSEKHANFIVNNGNATAEDVQNLVSAIRKAVWEKFGVDLEPEIKMVGK